MRNGASSSATHPRVGESTMSGVVPGAAGDPDIGVDPVVERRKRGQRHRLDPDDLLEDEVGAVEPECALVGPEGAERPLAAEGMQFVHPPASTWRLSNATPLGIPGRPSRNSVYSGA
jgi:hypothetical protein